MRSLQLALVLTLCAAMSGCESDDAGPSVTTDAGADTTADAKVDSAIDCSKVGCAPPPPCGETCKEVCGCCVNPSCADAGSDAKDASDATDASDVTDASDATD